MGSAVLCAGGVYGEATTKPDYITLSGSGEPTLYSRLDELVARIRSITVLSLLFILYSLSARHLQHCLS